MSSSRQSGKCRFVAASHGTRIRALPHPQDVREIDEPNSRCFTNVRVMLDLL